MLCYSMESKQEEEEKSIPPLPRFLAVVRRQPVLIVKSFQSSPERAVDRFVHEFVLPFGIFLKKNCNKSISHFEYEDKKKKIKQQKAEQHLNNVYFIVSTWASLAANIGS